MGGLQVRVSLVLGMPDWVVLERAEFRPGMLANQVVNTRIFVDVVAQMERQVELVLGQMLVRGEIPVFPVRAGGERESQPRSAGARRAQTRPPAWRKRSRCARSKIGASWIRHAKEWWNVFRWAAI